ncbi:twin-arginine translocase subunit TatC [Photobacterium sp. ZSDE20]|uniref:Sec-independent protein translocase protein TatC n=1 Tax=Photobacterium pectinilyticum TaxID=2906793 RepID=A0ABT1N4Z3_9GAMM|nr:twin-arginine translocase subunit TatC [Photobacterium sp. ZSDE20]MCQ1059823.1 twin-arginine translocase subunit TatC [Photobacterium sp. ZSDE20]MDD1826323.1 twin-arginine translocase subunit TatC [Photobacterium sp. ZSDE20]
MNPKNTVDESPILSRIQELKVRILRIVIIVLTTFLCLVCFSNDIYEIVSSPLIRVLPDDASMIATDVVSPFFAPLKLTLIVAFFVSMPAILFQVWFLLAPGLYRKAKKLVIPLIIASALLFYIGVGFAYFLVFPLVFSFFSSVSPEGVVIATDISSYLSFVLKIFLGFGLAFEIPVVTILLCWTNVITPSQLREKRSYVIVGVFVIGMILTPPDIISQTLLAIPMILLFELGLFFSKFYSNK